MNISDFINVLRKTRYLSRKASVNLPQDALAKEFFKLNMKGLIANSSHAKNDKYITIFGFKVKYVELHSLSYLFDEIFLNQSYYFYAQREEPFIIDCGSNIGISVLYFKKLYPKARIIGFEPSEIEFNILTENIRNNNLQDVEAFNLGLAEDEGTRLLFYNPTRLGSLSMSLLEERFKGHELSSKSIKTTCLSSYIDSEVDFLKIDIEGSELSVLRELDLNKKLSFVKEMVIEYHHHITKGDDTLSVVFSILENNGFGYQVSTHASMPFKKHEFQDILIFGYRKDG